MDLEGEVGKCSDIGKDLLKLAGVKSWNQFNKNSKSVMIEEVDGLVTMQPRLADLNKNTIGQGAIKCTLDKADLTVCLRQAFEIAV